MKFQLATDAVSQGQYLRGFLALAGESRWRKRVVNAGEDRRLT